MHCCGSPAHDIASNLPLLAAAVAPVLGWLRLRSRPKKCAQAEAKK